jgi:dUTP pyrophosphatase
MNPTSVLYISPTTPELFELYSERAKLHNILKLHPDAGFDIFTPSEIRMPRNQSTKVDFGIVCAMYELNHDGSTNYSKPQSFYMYPRSSISKSAFRLANNVGIIDSGYRGNIGAFFDIYGGTNDVYFMERGSRYIQLCNSKLEPFKVVVTNDVILPGGETERGAGGFGSTGR